MRPARLLAASLVCLAACAPPAGAPAVAAGVEAPPACKTLDFSKDAVTSVIEGQGVNVHTFRAPDMSSGTATHIIETADSLLLVDTQMLAHYAKRFRSYAEGLGKPITHVIISHGHPDHYFGMAEFTDLPIYALASTVEDIGQRQAFHTRSHRDIEGECDQIPTSLPPVTNELQPGTQTLGGVELHFVWIERGEDDDQLVIEIPAARTLILQDLLATDTHAFIAGGMVGPWIETLKRYAADEAYDHMLAGHGSPAKREALVEMIDYLQRGLVILRDAPDGESFTELMHTTFPERRGLYLVELMARLNLPKE